MANTITPLSGSSEFPSNDNAYYSMVETIAKQNIRAVKSSNRIEDAFYDYVVDDGAVIEEAIIELAPKSAFEPVASGSEPSFAPLDPSLHVKYFNNWSEKQYQTTIRKDDVRKVIANKGVGSDELIAEILGTLTEGESFEDYKSMRDIIKNASVGTDATPLLFGDQVAKGAKGIIYVMREMFNAVKSTNSLSVPCAQATPVEDIRICVSEDVLNLVDVVELANVFNLSKEELFGKLVVRPHDDDDDANKILVYDRKALGRGTRLYEYSQDIIGKARYSNHYLTTERCYFYNDLFKCLKVDVSQAVATAKASVLEDVQS